MTFFSNGRRLPNLPTIISLTRMDARHSRPSESLYSSTTSQSQGKNRSRLELGSSQTKSGGMKDEGLDSDGAKVLETAVMDRGSSGTSNGGNKKSSGLNSVSTAKAPSVDNVRMHMPEGEHSNRYRLDKENDTLIATSLGSDPTADAKVSERTSRHYFSQQALLSGESIAIAGFHSWSTTFDTFWIIRDWLAHESGVWLVPLIWSSGYSVIVATVAVFTDVINLSPINQQLLKQRGAVGKSSPSQEDVSK
ncbi:hypothetical protein BGX23_012131 [Mortierella sp. AD031]|nr:hypothetical protein BGX23_012131 [Mortierella sp. AD031]